MTSRSPRLRAGLVAGLLALALVGCEQEPSTTIDDEQEEPVPGEPGAAEPSPGPDVEEAEDVDQGDLPDEDQDGTATRGD